MVKGIMNPFNLAKTRHLTGHRNKWQKCERCPIACKTRAFHRIGGDFCNYMFIGDSPGPSESIIGKPFVGQTGKLLDQLIEDVGMVNYIITNNIICYPKDGNKFRQPTEEEIKNCRERLDELIEIVRPTWYISLGKVAKHNPPTGVVYHLELDHPSFIQRNGGHDSLVYRRNKHRLLSFMEKNGNGKSKPILTPK
jgi:hypothetical protein